jgi:hypothetical protein
MNASASMLAPITALLLTCAAVAATWRLARFGLREPAVWLQPLAAALLYCSLFPPLLPLRDDALTVLSPGAPAQAPQDRPVIALPGAPALARAVLVPDLATALREYPGARHLLVRGAGLSLRDREAVTDRDLQFEPAAPRGIVALDWPAQVPLGREWQIAGRALAPARRAELRDPAGALVDAVDLDAQGHFVLAAPARGAGPVRFELHLLGEQHALIDRASIPLVVTGGSALALVVRAGAINPELKYWRRWAADAGLEVQLTADVTSGVSLHAGAARLSEPELARTDLVILDSRAWLDLAPAEKQALQTAVGAGLGLLLRVDTPPTAATIAEWRELGFVVTPTATPRSVTLDHALGSRERTPFTLAPVEVAAPGSVVALAADDSAAVVWWRSQGQGRIGLSRLIDSYRLLLLGADERYSALWAGLLGTLSRPRPPPADGPRVPRDAWLRERLVLCGLGAAASVHPAADDTAIPLAVGADGCAAYWPALAGWQSLETAGTASAFYVRAADDAVTWRATLDRQATTELARAGVPGAATAASAPESAAPGEGAATVAPPHSERSEPMSRWPWAAAWLLIISSSWWRERRIAQSAGAL